MTKEQRTAVRRDELARYRHPAPSFPHIAAEPGVFAYMAVAQGERAAADRFFAMQDRLNELKRATYA